jgi:hypothetical protein
MNEESKSSVTFYCFTPMVSLATFVIELGLALFVLYRYKMTAFSRLAALIFILLGTFQLAEYKMCTGGNAQLWSKIGVASITLLPVMAMHLTTMLIRPSRWTCVGYMLGVCIIAAIFYLPVPILPHCTGKFVVLGFNDLFGMIFYLYYALFLFIALEMIVRTMRNHKGDEQELFWALMVYLAFLVPTAVVYFMITTSRAGVPSIMCGFAVFGALVVVFKELPRFYVLNKAKKRR